MKVRLRRVALLMGGAAVLAAVVVVAFVGSASGAQKKAVNIAVLYYNPSPTGSRS